jgi:diguanylate cyclase (GGDEF)-like protein
VPRFHPSIRARLTLGVAMFVVILIGLVAAGTVSLRIADRQAEALDQKWLTATAMLGELSDQVSEFRVAEEYRALAPDDEAVARADLLASDHRITIRKTVAQYAALRGSAPSPELDAFRNTWRAYEAAHADWLAQDPVGVRTGPAHYDSTAHNLYKAADEAVDALIDANAAEAHKAAALVYRIVTIATIAAVSVAIVAIGLAVWLIIRIRRSVTRPLEAITRGLSGLADGELDVAIPEFRRNDEIGKLARAFEAFRANVAALALAHETTRKAQEDALSQARHDALTGLPNRRVFTADLEAALHRSRGGAANYSVLLINLDRFKPVNDLLGHAAGDKVLCEVARRLKTIVRKTDTAVRLGADEFAIITDGTADPKVNMETAISMANRVLWAIRKPIAVGGETVEVGASVGITLCRPEHTDAETLLHEADIAMNRAKRDGKGVFRFFEPSMDEELRERAALEADLRQAVYHGEIRPYYQPLVDIHHNRVCGFEALARWTHEKRGAVPPDVFISLAEELGLISDLTIAMLRQACRDARSWPEDVRLSINISPSQFTDPLLPEWILAILAEEKFPPKRLEIEITETALVGDMTIARASMMRLQKAGVTMTLDDFGTGYATLQYLKTLRFDKVKIDRSFVAAMLDDHESGQIVRAILGLAKNLHLTTVAEGIENSAVLRELADQGCEYGQGYYFGKAMPADIACELLQTAVAA